MSIISKLNEEIKILYKKISEIQEECSHPKSAVESKNGAYTGGYDGPASDSYWVDHTCQLCEKKWREDQ